MFNRLTQVGSISIWIKMSGCQVALESMRLSTLDLDEPFLSLSGQGLKQGLKKGSMGASHAMVFGK
jgi:hypothetical protein